MTIGSKSARVAFVVVASAGLASCWGRTSNDFEVDKSVVSIGNDGLRVLHGDVGYGKFETRATYVLVDVENNHGRDLVVGIGGELLDVDGKPVATLRKEAMRIPAGGLRMYAPVTADSTHHPNAISARMYVTSTLVPSYDRMVVVEEGRVYIDNDRAVVDGWVTNTGKGKVAVIVIGAFWDADGNPVQRPHTIMEIREGERHPARFVGPPGSRKAMIFAGDTQY